MLHFSFQIYIYIYIDSKASLFPPTRSPNNPENYETTIPNPSLPSSFPPPNGQTTLSIPSHFPPARSPDNSEDCEMTIPNPYIPSLFPQVFPPPNGQTTHSIPLHFPPTISNTSSESNQTINEKKKKKNLSNQLLFLTQYKFEIETDDSTSLESNVTFCTISSRQIVVQGSHLQQLLPQQLSKRTRQHAQMYYSSCMQQVQAAQTTNGTSFASSISGYEQQQQQLHQMLQTQMPFNNSKQ